MLRVALLVVFLSGCITGEPLVDDHRIEDAPAEPQPPDQPRQDAAPARAGPVNESASERIVAVPNPDFNATAAYAREWCTDGCMFHDDDFHLAVSYGPHTTELQIVIAPAASSAPIEDLEAARAAVLDWQRALDEFAPAWLADGIELEVAAVGIDVPSIEAVTDPDILVLLAYGDRTGALGSFAYGQGIRPAEPVCGAPDLIEEPGITIWSNHCLGWGYECVALNTIQSGTPDHVFNMVVHEVGHCLGNGHTGNAADFTAAIVPHMDAMSYGSDPDRVSCVSNMNIEMMGRQFAPLLGQEIPGLQRGGYMTFPTADYRQGSCSPVEAGQS